MIRYDKEAGFLSNEFNGGNNWTGIKLPNGFFCFSSMNGWVFFNPDDIKAMIPDQEMIVDKIEIDDKEFPPTDSLSAINTVSLYLSGNCFISWTSFSLKV